MTTTFTLGRKLAVALILLLSLFPALLSAQSDFTGESGLEPELQPIEYRDGLEDNTVSKMPGLPKYTNITMKRPQNLDSSPWLDFAWRTQFEAGDVDPGFTGEPLPLSGGGFATGFDALHWAKTTPGLPPPSFEEVVQENESINESFVDLAEILEGILLPSGETPQLELPPVNCLPCDVIRQELEEKNKAMNVIVQDIASAAISLQDAQMWVALAALEVADYQQQLDALTNPKSWASSGDIYRDSADLTVINSYNAELWSSYQAGDMTAQEYESALEAGLTDEQREQRKQALKKDLEAKLAAAKQNLQNQQAKLQAAVAKLQALQKSLEECLQKIAELKAKLQECLKQCQEQEINIVATLGLGQMENPGFFGKLWDWLTGDEPSTEPNDKTPEELGIPTVPVPPIPTTPINPGGDTGKTFTPAVPDGSTLPPQLAVERCPKCDPLYQQITAKEKEAVELSAQLDRMRAEYDTLTMKKMTAMLDLINAQAALDAVENPRSWAESDGVRRDSADLEVQRDYNREQWESYRNGDISAEELQQRWENGLTDAERNARKTAKAAALKKAVDEAQAALDAIDKQLNNLSESVLPVFDKMQALLKEIEELRQQYDDCLKQCYAALEDPEYTLGGFELMTPATTETGPVTGTITFGGGITIGPGGGTIDLTEADQYDAATGKITIGGIEYGVTDDGGLIIPTTPVTDQIVIIPKVTEEDDGCWWFGWFCDDDESDCDEDPEAADCDDKLDVIEFDMDVDEPDVQVIDPVIELVDDSSSSDSSSSADSSVSSLQSVSSVASVVTSEPVSSAIAVGSSVDTSSEVSSVSSVARSSVESSSSVSSSSSEESSEPVQPENCDSPTMESADCSQSCEGTGQGVCERAYQRENGLWCYSCEPTESSVSSASSIAVEPSSSSSQSSKTCAEICAQAGFDQEGLDWSSYMQSYLNAYTCVSGASGSFPQATVGECSCSNQPTINVNTTVPVCTATACGDVACGSQATCDGEGGSTITVSCNWGGWQKIDINQFKPVIGQ